MDTAAINSAGLAPFRPELDRIGAIRCRLDLLREIARLHAFRIPAAFTVRAQPDQNAGGVVAALSAGGLGLDAGDYAGDDSSARAHREAYRARAGRLLRMAGVPQSSVVSRLSGEFDLERALAAQSAMNMRMDANMGMMNSPMPAIPLTAAVLQKDFPGFAWQR
jgi:putative endopeptidase